MKVLLEYAAAETNVKNSRFIAEVFPVKTQAEARDTLRAQKEKYSDATHVVHAFFTGLQAEASGLSDDGEPSGTAGRPVFEVLKGSGVTNIILTVTRYFGGTLLGTGGLVRAYSDAAKQVLALAKTEEYVSKSRLSFACSYQHYEHIKRMLAEFHTDSIKEDFASSVNVSLLVWASEAPALSEKIKNISKGETEVITEPCT